VEDDARLDKEFADRHKPDSTDDTRRLQCGKRLMATEEVRRLLGLDPDKKTAVIFSHVAWDAAFFYGTCLFADFEDWLFQTVRFVSEECPHMNWVVKVHPFNVFKLQRESVKETSEMRLLTPLMPLPEHVKIMHADTEINTRSLYSIVDYVLTVNGTVGMEFPCYGIPAIVAGTGRYNGRGFTIDPSSREEYFELLRSLQIIPKLNNESQQLARKHYLALMVGRQTMFDDVAPMELKRLHEAQSDVSDNIRVSVHSIDELRHSNSMSRLARWITERKSEDILDNHY